MNSLDKHRENLEDKEFYKNLNFLECSRCKLLFDKTKINSVTKLCEFCSAIL